ncbi:hypothetical protein Hypma_015407 [Hypsizygus marmoreus]|uniref:DUF6697 domain-containing protein n=1 Tax=Hypsizygus marmoreus TaxID=39966 RepID=A0A369K418_HYPMA|nr:hypothetical protein Hypma_015407 [Hypsizygus marmoreus]
MDEEFWATVVKKWSDACERILELKKELAEAQRESRQHQENARASQAQQERLSRDLLHLKEEHLACAHALQQMQDLAQLNAKTQHELNAAEASLHSAEIERMKLEEQLTAAGKQISVMSDEKHALDQKNDDLTQHSSKLQAELEQSRSDNVRLQQQLLNVQSRSQGLQDELERQRQMTFHESSNAGLLGSENKTLRDELVKARDSLHENHEMGLAQKRLLMKLAKLEDARKITSRPPPLRREAQVQTDTSREERDRILKPLPAAPVPSTMALADVSVVAKPIRDDRGTRQDSSEVVDENDLQVSLPMPVTTPTPAARLRSIEDLVQFIPDADDACVFRRQLLKEKIGGSGQPLIERVTRSQTALAKARNIDMYLCPGLDHNPCARRLQDNMDSFSSDLAKKRTFLEYRYLGVYTATHVAPLNLEEWNTLSEDVKYTYASTTRSKTQVLKNQSVQQVLTSYNTGQLSVPCVRLECTDFDSILYNALVTAQSKPRAVISCAIGKRVRDEHDDEYQPQRRTRAKPGAQGLGDDVENAQGDGLIHESR